jgi:uncharacterized protein (TIGR02145 family)
MKKTILYAIIATVTAAVAVAIVGCNGDFGSSSEGMNGFLERFHHGTKRFTVTYNGNGSDDDAKAPKDANSPYDSGATVKVLSEGALSKDGHNFLRWNTQPTGNGRNYSPDASFRITENVRLYAVWEDKSTRTYNVKVASSSPGTNVSGSGNYAAGTEVTIDAGMPPSGREFQGWNVTKGDVALADPSEPSTVFTMPAKEVEIWAIFTAVAGATNWFKDDRDGKEYTTVTIGEQTWMAQNLNYTPTGGNSWCYDNEPDNCNKYGRLYDWETAMDVCPVGWHLPSREEWGELAVAAGGTGEYGGDGGTAGTALKAGEPNWDGSDIYGFTALPGGFRNSTGDFCCVGNSGSGYWWTSTRSSNYTYHRSIMYDDIREDDSHYNVDGNSVRCIQGNDGPGYATELGVPSGLNATATPYSITLKWSAVRGAKGYFVYRSESLSGDYTSVGTTTSASYINNGLTSSTTYYYKVSTYNKNGDESAQSAAFQTATATITKITGKFTDSRDNKEYKTATIDGKTWMAENLNFTPTSGNSWCYGDDESNCETYGRLYDWATAMGINTAFNNTSWTGGDSNRQGVCPVGWHLPSRAEWGELAIAAGGTGINGTDGTAGKALKSTIGWNSNGNGIDDYSFSALPGGYYDGGSFNDAGNYGSWWTATEYSSGNAYNRGMYYYRDDVDEYGNYKSYGFSVRCVEDD